MTSEPIPSFDEAMTGGRGGAASPYAAAREEEPILKRPVDCLLAAVGLFLSAPLWLLAMVAIKLEDGGPIFYTQERWGRGGTKFEVRKFRTMVPNSERKFGLKQASEDDQRVTAVGGALRACGMDELPQLLNVLGGDMSLVGPRALAVGEIVEDGEGREVTYEQVPGFRERLAVRPGLTGLATVYIPKDASPRRKFRYDLLYIDKRSTWLDLRLVALSLWISVRGQWEARDRKV